ncbi:hypothetical protein D7V82_03660 [bacterium 1xD8-6]|nr:hypothetical protein D7V72_03785 [bacterium D16-36]RKI72391.1 hypothetical protein D7V82_03660 [bacterium 1xD8-6]
MILTGNLKNRFLVFWFNKHMVTYIRRKAGDELDAFLSGERELESLDVEAARVIKACTNTDIEIDEKAEVINVCKAVREMNEKAAEKAAEKARIDTLLKDIKNATEAFHVSIEDAMKALKVGKEDQAILMKMI